MISAASHPLLQIPVDELPRRPILDLAAQLWEPARYEAFRHFYRSMRRLDDLVDHRKELPEPILPDEQRLLASMLSDWLSAVKRQETEPEIARLNDLRSRYHLPLWPWERLVTAMQFDLSHRSFASWLIFRRYTEGAAIAPAAVFIYLATADAVHVSPQQARAIALPLALFAYLVHIIRDLRQDLQRGLFYIPDRWLARHSLTQVSLQMLFSEEGEIEDQRLANLLKEYMEVVRFFELRAVRALESHRDLFLPAGIRSLWLVRALYGQLAQRLYTVGEAFDPESLQPSGIEIHSAILELLSSNREDLPESAVSTS